MMGHCERGCDLPFSQTRHDFVLINATDFRFLRVEVWTPSGDTAVAGSYDLLIAMTSDAADFDAESSSARS